MFHFVCVPIFMCLKQKKKKEINECGEDYHFGCITVLKDVVSKDEKTTTKLTYYNYYNYNLLLITIFNNTNNIYTNVLCTVSSLNIKCFIYAKDLKI